MPKLDGYLRIKEAAEYLGVSPNTLRNWGRSGKLAERRHPINDYRLANPKCYARGVFEFLLWARWKVRRSDPKQQIIIQFR